MRTLKQLREDLDEVRDEVQQIVDLATKENRELTDEESKRFDHLADEVIPRLNKNIETRQKVDAEFKAAAAQRLGANLPLGNSLGDFGSHDTALTPSMYDQAGNPIFCLSKGQKLADTHPRTSENRDLAQVPFALGEMVKAFVTGGNQYTPPAIKNAMSTSTPSLGGFTVPGYISSQFTDYAWAQAPLARTSAMRVTMPGESLSFPRVASSPNPGVVGENQTIPKTDITLGNTLLSANKLAAITTASRELIEDSPLAAQIIEQTLIRDMGTQIDKVGIQGATGFSFSGLINSTDISSTGSIGALSWEDCATAVGAVRENNYNPDHIILGVGPHEDLMVSTTSSNDATASKTWLMAPPALEGSNLHPTNNCPTGYLIAGQFDKFVIGVRNNISVEITTEGDYFDKHQIAVKVYARLCYGLLDPAAFHRLEGITS